MQENRIFKEYQKNLEYLNQRLGAEVNFDVVSRSIEIGGRKAYFYFVDGFCKDEIMQKMLQYFLDLKEDEMPDQAKSFADKHMPYGEVNLSDRWDSILYAFFSGVFLLVIEGYDQILLIDSRTYPARNVDEPDKDKVLRGSKDGFVETIVFNTALIRRRIRSDELRMEMLSAGKSSKTDIVLCYMEQRVSHKFLNKIKERIRELQIDALSMNQESLAECLYKRPWYNPFPKYRYTERPDSAAAQILEGNIVILVDNSPSAMILPTTVFDVLEEADDYYFPPITGSYLRITRFLIALLSFFVTPTFLLFMQHREWIPQGFSFIILKEVENIPLIWQFLILELSIDGLRLAAVNTPTMLSTPLSVMAALVLGEFSVNSGWFNAEVMLYMAFVAIANYTQSNYELGYAFKFFRVLTLILTSLLGLSGYLLGVLVFLTALAVNKTVSGGSYLYPLLPFNGKKLLKRFFRFRLPQAKE